MKSLPLFAAALLVANAAYAAVTDIKEMADGSNVSVTGEVAVIEGPREFTLRDSSGNINVELAEGESAVFKLGDRVTVDGTLSRAMLKTHIRASEVSVAKAPEQALKDEIEAHTGASPEGATTHTTDKIPEDELVKVSGTVDEVKDGKSFILRDSGGVVRVEVDTPEQAALAVGSKVTVLGRMDRGINRNLKARKILVITDTEVKP